jgi:hypothetical protein
MTWLLVNPLFAWLLPLASVPVLFHLFFKLKKRPRVFPTLMFFDQIDPKLSARRQIRQWLVLLLRTLFLFFLLLALARPMWLLGGGGGRVAVVLVVDNSGSMSGPLLKTATEAARSLAGNLEANDTVGVVTLVDDPTVALPAGLDSDKAVIKTALERIVTTEASGQPVAALQRAFALLEASDATRFEVHIFTDAQETEWGRAAGELRPPRAGTTLTLHRLANPLAAAANLSVTSVEVPAKRLLAGRALALQVTVANPGATDAGARLNWTDDADNKGTLELAVPARAEKTVPVLLPPASAGRHWVQLWLEGDGFEADNKAGVSFACAERSPVLFLGLPGDFGFLPLALSPAAEGALSGLVPVFGTADDIARKKPLLVVAPWDRADDVRNYLEQGGNVLLTPGPTVPEWLELTADPLETPPQGAPVLLYRFNAAVLADLLDDKGQVSFRGVKAWRFHPLRPRDEQAGVFGLDDGRALFLERRLGAGMLFVSGTGFDATWSTLPLKSGFLAIAQSMALAQAEKPEPLLVAGHKPLAGQANVPLMVRSLAGSPLQWAGDASQPPVIPRAGIYEIQTESATRYLGVRSASAEGVAQFIGTGTVPALAGLNYTVRDFTDLATFLRQTIQIRRGLDLFLPLLLLAMVMLALEAWAANPLPRKAPAAPASDPKRSRVVVR